MLGAAVVRRERRRLKRSTRSARSMAAAAGSLSSLVIFFCSGGRFCVDVEAIEVEPGGATEDVGGLNVVGDGDEVGDGGVAQHDAIGGEATVDAGMGAGLDWSAHRRFQRQAPRTEERRKAWDGAAKARRLMKRTATLLRTIRIMDTAFERLALAGVKAGAISLSAARRGCRSGG